MNYSFTDEQQMFRDMFAGFVAKEVKPRAEHMDNEEVISLDVLRKSAMQGFLGALMPEEFGGAALDAVSYILLLEEVAKSCMSMAMVLHVHNGLAGQAIQLHGTPKQQEAWLPAMAEGSVIGAWALAEPDGSSLDELRTVARPDGEGYVLDGVKAWVSNASIAGLTIVFAAAPEGPTAFLIPADTPGVTLGQRDKTLGMRGVQVYPLYLDHVRVDAAAVLGTVDGAQAILDSVDNFSRLALASIALGGAHHALDLGVNFAIERKQFGVEIAQKGAIQAFIADSAMEVETLRSQIYRCASLAEQDKLDGEAAAIAKLWANRVAYQVANRMIQTHGGYGYILDYAIGRVFRDCRTIEGIEGGNRSQQTAIARSVLAAHGYETA